MTHHVIHRLFACVVLVCALGISRSASAQYPGLNSWDVGSSTPTLVGMIVVDAVTLGTGVANMYFIGKSERAPTTAIISYIAGVAGVILGGIAFAADSSAVKAIGGVTVGMSVVNAGLATWNLTGHSSQERQLAVKAGAVSDSRGKTAPSVAFAGTF